MRRMHMRGLVALAGAVGVAGLAGVTGLAACDPGGGRTARAGDEGPASPGTTPTALPTPSLPPSAGPIATGLRVDGAALLVWFDGTGMDSAWYDPGTGRVVTGPAPMAAWPAPRRDLGFQRVIAASGRDGRIVVYGWLIGAAERIWLQWRGTRTTGTLLPWPVDPRRQVFWLRAGDWVPAVAPSPLKSPGTDAASLVGADAGGRPLFDLPLS
jgi:hypothetical protein